MNCPFVQHVLTVYKPTQESLGNYLSYQIYSCGIIVLVFESLLFYLTITSKHKSSYVGNSDVSKNSRKVLPFSEKAYDI